MENPAAAIQQRSWCILHSMVIPGVTPCSLRTERSLSVSSCHIHSESVSLANPSNMIGSLEELMLKADPNHCLRSPGASPKSGFRMLAPTCWANEGFDNAQALQRSIPHSPSDLLSWDKKLWQRFDSVIG